MPHYTDKDMSYEEFSKLLKDRYEKGESTDDYSYKSSKNLKPCKVKKLLNNEIVTGMLNPDGSFTDIKPLETPEYEIPADDKVKANGVWIEDTDKESEHLSVYKRVWDSNLVFFKVGYYNNGSVVLDSPKYEDTYWVDPSYDEHHYNYDLRHYGYPKTVQKFSPIWYKDTELTDKNITVDFVPSNDVYEIINTNKNESIGYVSHEGKVIYWNQYRS